MIKKGHCHITTEQIRSLQPVEIIRSPGKGKVIDLINVQGRINMSVPFTFPNIDSLDPAPSSGHMDVYIYLTQPSFGIDQTLYEFYFSYDISGGVMVVGEQVYNTYGTLLQDSFTSAMIDGEGIEVAIYTDVHLSPGGRSHLSDGDIAGGDTTIDLQYDYRIVTL
jgi:hypothetical protein